MARYKVSDSDINFRNGTKSFLCQNAPCPGRLGESCPCALISVWNYHILQNGVPCKEEAEDGYMTEKVIRNHLFRIFVDGMERLKGDGFFDDNYDHVLAEARKCINSLSTGIELEPDSTSPAAIGNTPAGWLLAGLGVIVFHCHVVDPEASDETTKFADSTSSEALKEGQLTNYGLSRLLQCLEEGKLCLLYRNGHYSVLLKQEGILLTLETDECVLKDRPTAIWKRLTVVEEDSFYLTSRFSPTKDQRHMEKADQWYYQNMNEKFGEQETQRTSKQLLKEARNARRTLGVDQDCSTSNMGGNLPCPSENQKDDFPAELPMVIKRNGSPPKNVDKDDDPSKVVEQFFTFLMEFKDGHTKPYFEGIIESIKYHNLPKMYVPYELIKRYDERLAITIRDQSPRIQDDLKKSFVRYLAHYGFDLSAVEKNAELHICDLPKPKSTQSLKEFADDNKLIEDYLLSSNCSINSTSHIGRRMALGFLIFILEQHEAGLCWHGKFEASHFMVRNNGLEFFIDMAAVEDLTQEGGVADLLKYCEIIFPSFEGEDGKYPLYFDEFQTDCIKMPDPKKEPVKWKRFLKLIRSAFAFKAPAARSALICSIYTLASAKTIANRPFPPLNQKTFIKWNKGLRVDEPFKSVYDHANRDRMYTADRWGSTYWYLLKFSRHFIQHVLDHLKGLILLHDITVIELMLSHKLAKFLADFIRYFVFNCDVDDMFYSAWAHFEASDCYDKATENVPKANN